MKPRKVMVHLELLSNVSIKALKNKERWALLGTIGPEFMEVQQVTVQVVKEKK